MLMVIDALATEIDKLLKNGCHCSAVIVALAIPDLIASAYNKKVNCKKAKDKPSKIDYTEWVRDNIELNEGITADHIRTLRDKLIHCGEFHIKQGDSLANDRGKAKTKANADADVLFRIANKTASPDKQPQIAISSFGESIKGSDGSNNPLIRTIGLEDFCTNVAEAAMRYCKENDIEIDDFIMDQPCPNAFRLMVDGQSKRMGPALEKI